MPSSKLEFEEERVSMDLNRKSLSLRITRESQLSLNFVVRACVAAVVLSVLFISTHTRAQTATPIRIDASQPFTAPEPALFREGTSTSPSGSTIGVNNRYLSRDGKPWLPVMGEFHFSRYPRAQWEEEILKMKAAGVDIVATYVFWIHHEEIQGQFDWSGQRDLRAFTQLCARHGMYVFARIGPWAHGEARNGGLPDWVIKQAPTRQNDSAYLASVRLYYGQVGQQLNGLLFKDGGPVIGIQLENEYSKRGPGAGDEHILELKKIALASGLDVPLYTVTAWDNAVVPQPAVLPIYGGGYPDAPWDGSIRELPPSGVYFFHFRDRANSNIAQGATPTTAVHKIIAPFFTAETGGGIQDTYHRRPVIQPDDIAALFPVALGSGVNLYGTYMFQGGENPDGKLSTLQESQDTGYPNDVPIKSYDFQAPLGEFGQERPSLRKMKVFDYFLNDFGSDLAPMTVHAPDLRPADPADLTIPRASVRSRGDAGFIFLNNYVRNDTMPARSEVQFQIHLSGGDLQVPIHPIDIPSGAYFIWPFNLRLGGINLRYSTAQLFTRLTAAGLTTYYFESIPGIPAEFAIDAATVRSVTVSGGEEATASGIIYFTGIKPGINSSIDLVSAEGKAIRIVILTASEAEDAWKIRIAGQDHLLLTEQDFFADPEAKATRIWLRSRGTSHFAFSIQPPLSASLQASLALKQTSAATFTADARAVKPEVELRQTQPAGEAPPVKLGPRADWRPNGVAQAPGESDMPRAEKWSISIPAGSMAGLSDLFLDIDYQGDVARLSARHKLLDDDFYNGKIWEIGLARFLKAPGSATPGSANFSLSILPLRKDAPVYFELPKVPDFAPSGQIVKLDSARLVPEYQLVLESASH